jgi:hypothetical protein
MPNHDDEYNHDNDHVCPNHDCCRLVHLKHRSTGRWFEYHVQHSRIIATVYDGTSFGHDDSNNVTSVPVECDTSPDGSE